MEIIIGKPIVKDDTLSSCVMLDGIQKKLFYKVDSDVVQYAVSDRCDGFLVSILPLAMIRAKKFGTVNIKCEAPVSQRLYHQLKYLYIPTLSRNISYYGEVNIDAEVIDEPLQQGNGVATGISGGVDSSYTVAKYTANDLGRFKLTYGVYFNWYGYQPEAEAILRNKTNRICDECGLNYMCIESNICKELYHKAYAPVIHNVFIGAILSFSKLFSVYYYSSTVGAEDFYFSEKDAAYYDWLNLMCFSTDNTLFLSSGMETTRIDKVEYITDAPFTYNNLSVCLSEVQNSANCGRCAKCTRTLTELDALQKLHLYKKVFDIDVYNQDKDYHWSYVILKAKGGDTFSREIIEKYKQSGRKIPMSAYIEAFKKWVKRGFTTENKQREKVEDLI